jgi:hypothetical protein
MRPMAQRLRLLEQAFLVPDVGETEHGPAATVRACRERRLQMEGGDVPPQRFPVLSFHRNMTLAEVIRHRRYGPRQVRAEGLL